MKKIFFITIFVLSLFLQTKAFAATCATLTATTTNNTVQVVATGCPVENADKTKIIYKIMVSEGGFNKVKDFNLLGGRYSIAKNTLEGASFNISLPASLISDDGDGNLTTHIFTTASLLIIKKSDEAQLDAPSLKDPVLIQEVGITNPITFRDLVISKEDQNGYTTVAGGIQSVDTIPQAYIDSYRFITNTDKAAISATPPTGQPYTVRVAANGAVNSMHKFEKKNPGDIVYARQSYIDPVTKKTIWDVWDPKKSSVDSVYGNNVVQKAKDLETKSYGLLSSVWKYNPETKQDEPSITFYDPGSDICKSKNGLCSFSDVLNWVIMFAIGLAVVFLVIRIMIEGFTYMTTDIPGVKISAKSSITDMAIGLLIALGSWVILNTVNPTLVNNTLNIPGVNINVDHYNPTAVNYQHDTHGGAGGGKASPTKFLNQKWHDAALAAVQASSLPSSKPIDAKKWFPNGNGQLSAEDWVSLIAGVAKAESGFDPRNLYTESFVDDTTKQKAVSVGLMQLSVGDCPFYLKTSCTQAQLEDPIFNLNLSVKIFDYLIKKNNVISGKNASGKVWIGATAYWSTLRK